MYVLQNGCLVMLLDQVALKFHLQTLNPAAGSSWVYLTGVHVLVLL